MSRKPTAATVTTATFVVGDCPIQHDGDAYAPGDEIELTEAQALSLGTLVTPKAPAANKE